MIGQDAARLTALIRAQFGLLDLLPLMARLLIVGQPVMVEQAAEAGGWSASAVRAELARHPGVDWDQDGRIVGFGMTLRPTPHRFTVDGHTGYGFCASDTLTYPVILDRPCLIESRCPVTGQRIRVEVTPDQIESVDPAGTVVSRVRPEVPVVDVRAEICNLGNFFQSAQAGAEWQSHVPDATLVPIGEDFEVCRLAMIELGWAAA